MKKAFLTLCVIALTTMTVFADGGNEKTEGRYCTPKFNQGWFVDLAGTYSIFAGTGSAYHQMTTYYGGFNETNPKHLWGFSGKIGRRVSPSFAVRVGYDRHRSYNATTDFYFKSLHFDAMESPLDLFLGYNPDRLYTMWIYGGVGLLACDPVSNMRPYNLLIHWDSNLELGFHGGIMNNFRLSDALDLHIDLTAVATRWSFDAKTLDTYSLWHRAHFDFSGMVGLMWYIGGRELDFVSTEVTNCDEQEARINELLEQINNLQGNTGNEGNDDPQNPQGNGTNTITNTITVQGEVITYPFSIFFNKGSYELRDGRDRINLQEIAQAAIDHDLMITLKGTCDAATASAAFNKTLAENRCNKVKSELVKIGVPAENITIEAIGGVTDLKPAEYDRRVIVLFSEKK